MEALGVSAGESRRAGAETRYTWGTLFRGLTDHRERSIGDIVLHGLLNGFDVLLLSLWQVSEPDECLDRVLIHVDLYATSPQTAPLPMGASAQG